VRRRRKTEIRRQKSENRNQKIEGSSKKLDTEKSFVSKILSSDFCLLSSDDFFWVRRTRGKAAAAHYLKKCKPARFPILCAVFLNLERNSKTALCIKLFAHICTKQSLEIKIAQKAKSFYFKE